MPPQVAFVLVWRGTNVGWWCEKHPQSPDSGSDRAVRLPNKLEKYP